jgi:hypothetical protein
MKVRIGGVAVELVVGDITAHARVLGEIGGTGRMRGA